MKIKIRLKYSEIKDFGNFINAIFQKSHGLIKYSDYYNLVFLVKRLFDFHYKYVLFQRRDKIKLFQIDVNTFETLLSLYSMNKAYIDQDQFTLARTIFLSIISEGDKQKQALNDSIGCYFTNN